MKTYTAEYDPISYTSRARVTCPGCGRKRTIRRTFYQTVNPFNRNDDGTVKTSSEVADAVFAEAEAWEPSGRELWHARCWDGATGPAS